MHTLTEDELYQALHYARSIDEAMGRTIIEQFNNDQPLLAQAVFTMLPEALAQASRDMSYMFMDLCFDLLCIFQKSFGPLPEHTSMNAQWFEKQALLLDTELQALMTGAMTDQAKTARESDFLKRIVEDSPQPGLSLLMNEAVSDYALENTIDPAIVKTTQTMLFIVIRLLSNLYSYTDTKKTVH